MASIFDERFLGNSRVDPCSKILKRNMSRKYVKQFDPAEVILYLGIDWSESHRIERAHKLWLPYKMEAPLCEKPYISKKEMLNSLPIEIPNLYKLGFPHNNCGGFCVKAGHAHFRNLLKTLPNLYAYHEGKEEEIREYLGKNVAILRDRRGKQTKPLTLKEFRERNCEGTEDWGGCGCFLE